MYEFFKGDENFKEMTAIIGFWKQNEQNAFSCYHYFAIRNPLTREVNRSNQNASIPLQQLLFRGSENQLFFMYERAFEGSNEMKLAILNLHPEA